MVEEIRRFEKANPCKLIFEPEDVVLSAVGQLPEGAAVANGVIERGEFRWCIRALILRLDLVSRR